jgi:hypothetical protein
MRSPWIATLSLASSLVAPLGAGTVPEWLADDELFPSTNQNGDRYGYAAALAGRWLAVGAPVRDPGSCSQCGEVLLYQRDPDGEWIERDALAPSGAGTGHNLGYHMDFDGGGARLAVSAAQENGGRGAAYVYLFDPPTQTWSEEQRVVPTDTDSDRAFGPCSIDGGWLLVGAPTDDEAAANAGAAYLFAFDPVGGDWEQALKLTAPDAEAEDRFGVAVALSGDWALVAAYFEDDNGDQAGAAYLFGRNIGGPDQWGFSTKLLASDGATGDLFGTWLALEGDIAVVGAFNADLPGLGDAGAAWVFERDHPTAGAWGERKKLTAPDAGAGDTFGRQVAIDGDRVAIGAAGSDQGGTDMGGVHIFQRDLGGADAWGLLATAAPTTGTPGQCGHGAALDGPFAACGRPFDGELANRENLFVDPAWIFSDPFESGEATYWSLSFPP